MIATNIVFLRKLETAIGGEYKLPDGRVFWMDRQAALEVLRRILPVIGELENNPERER